MKRRVFFELLMSGIALGSYSVLLLSILVYGEFPLIEDVVMCLSVLLLVATLVSWKLIDKNLWKNK